MQPESNSRTDQTARKLNRVSDLIEIHLIVQMFDNTQTARQMTIYLAEIRCGSGVSLG